MPRAIKRAKPARIKLVPRERANRGPRPSNPHSSMAKSLLVTAVIGLVAGLVGAMAYSYMFGAKSDTSASGQSQSKVGESKGGSVSKKSSNTEKGSGGEEDKEWGPGWEPEFETADRIPIRLAGEVEALKNEIMDLMERVGTLTGRLDRMVRVNDEMPALLQTLQIELGETARKMTEWAPMVAKVRDDHTRLETLLAEVQHLHCAPSRLREVSLSPRPRARCLRVTGREITADTGKWFRRPDNGARNTPARKRGVRFGPANL